jgi:xanthine/CO dehydrogenase XdhC/CoxF family maturation factor
VKELAEIVKAYAAHGDESLAMATVVQTTGSSYRRPGARMLILPNRATIGSISGGCLEQDVIDKAADVCRTGQPVLLTYDTSTEEDIIFGVGLGCDGLVKILLEPVRRPSILLSFLENLMSRRETGIVATLFQIEGSVPAQTGDRLLLEENGHVMGSPLPAVVTQKLLTSAQDVASSRRSANVRFEMDGGALEAFVEIIDPPAALVLFGAGYDAIPMVRLAKELGFHVTVIDGRPAYAQTARFPQADEVITAHPGEELPCRIDERTSAIIMSHNYLADRGWLKKLLPLNLRYLGLMGPRKRAEKMLRELRQEEGIQAHDLLEGRLHSPVGLDIGAEGPEQIALAVLAEIQAACTGHSGGMLREKKGAIHSPAAVEA